MHCVDCHETVALCPAPSACGCGRSTGCLTQAGAIDWIRGPAMLITAGSTTCAWCR